MLWSKVKRLERLLLLPTEEIKNPSPASHTRTSTLLMAFEATHSRPYTQKSGQESIPCYMTNNSKDCRANGKQAKFTILCNISHSQSSVCEPAITECVSPKSAPCTVPGVCRAPVLFHSQREPRLLIAGSSRGEVSYPLNWSS